MSDIADVSIALGNAALHWKQAAETMERERNEALATTARLVAALEELKASIEWSQSNEAVSHFTVNRPMAEIAHYYAIVCAALAATARTAPGATDGSKLCPSCKEPPEQHIVICTKDARMVNAPNVHAAAPGLPITVKQAPADDAPRGQGEEARG